MFLPEWGQAVTLHYFEDDEFDGELCRPCRHLPYWGDEGYVVVSRDMGSVPDQWPAEGWEPTARGGEARWLGAGGGTSAREIILCLALLSAVRRVPSVLDLGGCRAPTRLSRARGVV